MAHAKAPCEAPVEIPSASSSERTLSTQRALLPIRVVSSRQISVMEKPLAGMKRLQEDSKAWL